MDKKIRKNRFRGVLFGALMLVAGQAFAAWNGNMEKPETSKIDSKDYYIIKNEAQLAWFANETNKAKGYKTNINAKLDADLDMGGKLWTPIVAGKGDRKFTGIFDGDGHVISNLYINGDQLAKINSIYAQNVGFVAALGTKGQIRNVIFENAEIYASNNAGSIIANNTQQISVGVVVGWMADGTVSGCYTTGYVKSTGNGQAVGGIVGNAKNGKIENSMSVVSIQATGNDAYVGGVVGITKASVTVKSCVYDGEGLSNSGNGSTGAIVGNHLSGKLTTSTNYYDDDLKGVGLGTETKNTNIQVENTNTAEVACALNNGKLVDGVCDPDSPWSVGEKKLALNGYGAATMSIFVGPKVTQYGAVTITEYPEGKVVAEINGEYTGADTVKITEDIHVDEIVLNKTFTVGLMETIMLPFSMDVSKISGAKFYKLAKAEENNGKLNVRLGYLSTSQMVANTPYFVMPTETSIMFDGGAVFNTESAPAEELTWGAWEFNGVYAYTTFKNHPERSSVYNFIAQERNGSRVGTFVKVDETSTMSALKAYLVKHQNVALAKSIGGSLDYSLPTEVNVQIVDENDNVIETGTMDMVTGQIRMNGWYDMKGRKLNAKPTTRGTYYHNGKRVFVK